MNQEELNKIERKRRTIYSVFQTVNIAIGILFIGTFLFIILNVLSPDFETFFALPFITFLLMMILNFISQYLKNLLKKEISKLVYAPAFKEKNTEFNYESGLTLNEVMSSKLLPRPDDFVSNSLTKGEISGFPYKASNITLWEENKETDSDGHSRTTRSIIFDGRMYIIETPFNKKGIIIKSKIVGAEYVINKIVTIVIAIIAFGIFLSILLHSLSDSFFREDASFFIFFIIVAILILIVYILFGGKEGYQEAKLESSKFNEYFEVQTQDQVELRKTLTPTVMEKLINLRNIIGNFDLSIIGNKIFFAFPQKISIQYDKPIQKLIEDAKETVEEEIETIKSIIETLKLEEERIKKGI
jgi:hypothetical protein